MNKPDFLLFNNVRFLDAAKEQENVPFLNDAGNSVIKNLPKNRDVSYGEAISVSSYANANGYYFTNKFLLKNYRSLLYKPMNVAHNKNSIIGVIYDTAIIGQESGDIIDPKDITFDFSGDPTNLDEALDVHIKFMLFDWLFPQTSEEIKKGIDPNDPETAKYKVSMEIWPIEYGFNFDKDESTFVKKTDENQFLDKYVGLEYNGKYVSRQYVDGDFAGTGFVERPANHRSLILDMSIIEDTNKQFLQVASRDLSRSNERASFIDNHIIIESAQDRDKENKTNMENNANMEITKEQIEKMISEKFSAIEDKINTAMVNDKSLQEQEAREKVLTQEITNSTKEIENLKAELAEARKSLSTGKEAQEGLQNSIKDAENEKQTLQEANEKLQKELEEANEAIKVFKQKEVGENRIAELAKINVIFPEEKKEEKIGKYGMMTDEEWNSHYADMKDLNLKAPEQKDGDQAGEGESGKGDSDTTSDQGSTSEPPKSGNPDSAGVLNGKEEPVAPDSANSRKVMSLLTPRGQQAFKKTGTDN